MKACHHSRDRSSDPWPLVTHHSFALVFCTAFIHILEYKLGGVMVRTLECKLCISKTHGYVSIIEPIYIILKTHNHTNKLKSLKHQISAKNRSSSSWVTCTIGWLLAILKKIHGISLICNPLNLSIYQCIGSAALDHPCLHKHISK
jgi:hypothetical protein